MKIGKSATRTNSWALFLAFSLIWLIGCGTNDDAVSDYTDQSVDDDDDNVGSTPGDSKRADPNGVHLSTPVGPPSLLIAGRGGLFWTNGEQTQAIYENADVVFKRIILLPNDEQLLIIGYEEIWGTGVAMLLNPDTLVAERMDLPLEKIRFTLESGTVDVKGQLWLVGGDDTNGNGLLLKRDLCGQWQRIDFEPTSQSQRWSLTAITYIDGELQMTGFMEDQLKGMTFIVDIDTNEVKEIANAQENFEDRDFMPRRLIPMDAVDELWMIGSYLDAENDPMLFWNETVDMWKIASSCSLETHYNYWGGLVDGRIFFTGSISTDQSNDENARKAMMVEYDPEYEDPLGEEFHWIEHDLPFDNGKALYHIQKYGNAFFYVYLDFAGMLHLYEDGNGTDFNITDRLAHVYAVRYLNVR